MRTYLRHRILNVIDVKELMVLEYLDFDGKYKDYEETHDFWELCYVEKGSVTLTLEDEATELCQNELMIISPNKRHSYDSAKSSGSRVFVMCFQCLSQSLKVMGERKFLPDSDQQYTISRIITESQSTFSMDNNDQLKVLPDPNFGGQQVIMLQLEHLLICLLRSLSASKKSGVVFLSDNNFEKVFSEAVTSYLNANICARLTLNDVCKKFNYSRSFICRSFKKQTGKTLIGYFNELKIREAVRLIKDTDRTAASIAGQLGFQDVKYFNVLFKKHMGCAPIEYRRRPGTTSESTSPDDKMEEKT